MTNLTVAKTIAAQIGAPAFAMMGARDLVGDVDRLTWKIGRNAKRVKAVQVILDTATDTYTVRFLHQKRAPSFEVVELARHSGVYVDMLHEIIESETGLYLSL
jgi:hypothetical protein